MDNPFSTMRRTNIFGQDSSTPGMRLPKRFMSGLVKPFEPDEDPEPEESQGSRYFKELERMRGAVKAGPARASYEQTLSEMPTREEYKPSGWRRLGAAVAGAAGGFSEGPSQGAALADNMLSAPYRGAQSEWQQKLKGKGESAKLEQDDIEAQMTNLRDAQRMGLDYAKYQSEYADKAEGRRLGRDTLNETVKRDNNLNSHYTRSDATAEAGQRETARNNRIGNILGGRNATTGEVNAETNRARQQVEYGLGKGRLENDTARTGAYVESTKNGKTPSATQQAYAVDNALRELKRDPNFAPFIKLDSAGKYDYEAPPEGNSLMYQEFQKRLNILINKAKKTGNPLDPTEDEDDDDSIIIGAPIPGRR